MVGTGDRGNYVLDGRVQKTLTLVLVKKDAVREKHVLHVMIVLRTTTTYSVLSSAEMTFHQSQHYPVFSLYTPSFEVSGTSEPGFCIRMNYWISNQPRYNDNHESENYQ